MTYFDTVPTQNYTRTNQIAAFTQKLCYNQLQTIIPISIPNQTPIPACKVYF